MAPVSDSSYFPPLEDCLFGERLLLSWKYVATALSDASGQRQTCSAIMDFFDDEYVHGLFKHPASVFSPTDDKTNKEFETRTAPINVTTVNNNRVDINLVKEDAKWLSRNAKLNLVAALRLVVIEFQSRPSRHLTGPLSSQDATNLQEAAGLNNSQGSSFLSDFGAAAASDADQIWTEFEKPDSKRRRLFDVYLSERRHFMMAADYVQSMKLYGRLPILTQTDRNLAQLYQLKVSSQPKDEIEALFPVYLQALTDCMNHIERGLDSWTDEKFLNQEEIEIEWLRTLLTEIIHIMSVVFQLSDRLDDYAPSSCVNHWFGLMEAYCFFAKVQPIHASIAELILPLGTLSSAISLSLLKPARSIIYLAERENDPTGIDDIHDSYLLSSDVLEQVHKSMMASANVDSEAASPVIFTWCHILHQMNVSYQGRAEKRDNLLNQNARDKFEGGPATARPSTGRRNSAGSIFSIESSRFDTFLETAAPTKDLSVVKQLAETAIANNRMYDVISRAAYDASLPPLMSSRIRTGLLEVLKVTSDHCGYSSETVETLISLLSADQDYWDITPEQILSPDLDVRSAMLQDDDILNVYLKQALDGYPFEFLPFITFCRTLCTAPSSSDDDQSDLILRVLRKTPTLTFILPDSFQQFEPVNEEDSDSSFCLLEEFPLISLSSSWQRRQIEDSAYRIPVGTCGRFLSNTGRVVMMDYAHSTLSLLGRRLEINLMPEGYQVELGLLQSGDVAEVISLFATLIRVDNMKAASSNPNGAVVHVESDIIYDASKHITGGKDLITVVCDTMDYYLQDELAMSDEAAVGILNSCIQFLDAVLPTYPSRVWSYLARSELLSSENKAGKLARITGTLDLMSSRFDFLNSSLRLFSTLIESAISSAVQRRAGNKSIGRQRQDSNPWLGTASKVLSRVTYSMAQVSVDVFENTSTWRFESEIQRISLLSNVVPVMNNIIRYCFSMGDAQSSDNLTSTLRPAALYILDCFVEPSTGTLRFQPILSSFITALATPDSTLYPARVQKLRDEISSVLEFSTTLLRVSNLLEQTSSMVEAYLFKSCTLLARLCAFSDYYRIPAIGLLDALVVNAGKSTTEPLSLLGYLGPQISKSFLQSLSTLGRPYSLTKEVGATWRLFSTILRNRQQWMSNCLLTGQTPREAMKKDSKANELAADSIFAVALRKLSKLKDLDTEQALVILDFVASAQNYWPWTIFTLQKDTTYLDGLQAYVRDLKPSHLTVKTNATQAAVEARIAAYIGETFAMQLYHSRHIGNADALAKKLMTDLDYFLRDGVEVSGYNKSLHNNFARNFANKYSGTGLDNFQRTLLEPRDLGSHYYYDVSRANSMLCFDAGWLGKKDNGFKAEMELANTNLSLVDAQIALFHAWEFLLLELSICLGNNDIVAKQMLQVAQQCLNANQSTPGSESIFVKVVDSRANLALVLIQRLAKIALPAADVNQLLETVVGTINGVDDPFSSDNIPYYRTLLKALFVTLRAYQNSDNKVASDVEATGESSVKVTQAVLNILDRVVGKGFRALVSLIHDNDSAVVPEDLALLTAIMQACLSLPSMDQSQTQILNMMASHSCVYAATSLFSWADKLADQGDPVYGELSILFLLELSTLPLLAEQMACDGVLNNLLSANLTKYMLKSNISPYAEIPVAQRCYGIWTKGFLPLMLNLLTALGATVAPEIAYVLNQFPHLLRLSIDRFEAPGASRTQTRSTPHYLTLLAASEVHTLALLTRIIAALRVNNNRDIPEVEWDAAALLENVDFWLSTEKLLKERLLPLGARELEWRGMKNSAGGGDNVLEQKITAQLEAVRDVLNEEVEAE